MITKLTNVKEDKNIYEFQNKTDLDAFCMRIKNSLEEFYQDAAVVSLHKVNKNNGVILNGITILQNEKNIAPTIYLEELFALYQNGIPYFEIVKKILSLYEESKMVSDFDINFFECYEQVKTRLIYKLVNFEMNQEMLRDVPYFRFLDLAGICYCSVVSDMIGNGSILIHTEHLKLWNIDEKTLFQDAKKNMPKIFPVEWENMLSVMQAVFTKQMNEEMEETFKTIPEGRKLPMYILGNTNKLDGASSILYEGVLEGIAAELEGDFYILPSSVHEVIIVPKNGDMSEEELSEMVREVNATQLETEEILSDHAYLYDSIQNQIISLPLIPE